MKKNNVLGVFYPIFLYYLVSSFAFFGMTIIFGEAPEIYMLKQMVSSGATIPFLLSLKKQDVYAEEVVYGKSQKSPLSRVLMEGILSAVSMAAFGIALNNFIAMTHLIEVSTGFQTANEAFFGGGMLLEILASCLVVPIAEELLFRGIVLKRASALVGERLGIVFSALLFGVIHVNLVQFLYASVLGILLALLVQKTKRVSVAVIGHAAANFVAILRANTGWLDFSYEQDLAGIGFTVLMAGIGSVILWMWFRVSRKNK